MLELPELEEQSHIQIPAPQKTVHGWQMTHDG